MNRGRFGSRRVRHVSRTARGQAFTDDAELMKSWREFKVNADDGLRNRLIEHYLYLVRFAAERIGTDFRLQEVTLGNDAYAASLLIFGAFGEIELRATESFRIIAGGRFETATQKLNIDTPTAVDSNVAAPVSRSDAAFMPSI